VCSNSYCGLGSIWSSASSLRWCPGVDLFFGELAAALPWHLVATTCSFNLVNYVLMLMKSLLSLQRSTVLVRCVNLWGEFLRSLPDLPLFLTDRQHTAKNRSMQGWDCRHSHGNHGGGRACFYYSCMNRCPSGVRLSYSCTIDYQISNSCLISYGELWNREGSAVGVFLLFLYGTVYSLFSGNGG
jgi:hypothetical protein